MEQRERHGDTSYSTSYSKNVYPKEPEPVNYKLQRKATAKQFKELEKLYINREMENRAKIANFFSQRHIRGSEVPKEVYTGDFKEEDRRMYSKLKYEFEHNNRNLHGLRAFGIKDTEYLMHQIGVFGIESADSFGNKFTMYKGYAMMQGNLYQLDKQGNIMSEHFVKYSDEYETKYDITLL